MCKYIEKLNTKKYTGYKFVVTDEHGHHYSPFTGIRYQVGPVPTVNNKHNYKYRIYHSYALITDTCNFHYNETQSKERLTAVFSSKAEAILKGKNFANNISHKENCKYKYNIVKMTLSGDMFTGYYDSTEVYLGNYINSISIVKTENINNQLF